MGRVGRVRLPEDSRAPPRPDGVEGDEDAAPVEGGGGAGGGVPVVPGGSRGEVGAGGVSEGEAVVEEAEVGGELGGGDLGGGVVGWGVGGGGCGGGGEEGPVGCSAAGGCEAGGDDARVVAALEGVGFLAVFGVAVVVFLQRTGILKPILHLLGRSLLPQLLTRPQIFHQSIHIRRNGPARRRRSVRQTTASLALLVPFVGSGAVSYVGLEDVAAADGGDEQGGSDA